MKLTPTIAKTDIILRHRIRMAQQARNRARRNKNTWAVIQWGYVAKVLMIPNVKGAVE